MPQITSSTGLAITNPLVLYRSLIATKRIEPDPAQHRLALHLQKLYYRLKDYKPGVDFNHRLAQLNRITTSPSSAPSQPGDKAHKTYKISNGIFSTLRGQKEKTEITALTRRLTSHESAIQLESPQGLLLYGEVGTGKSLLIDLLAECLPNHKKRRWHFNTFMLETFARLEQLRTDRLAISPRLSAIGAQHEEHSLLSLARDMISTSPILFLDEFQLPDRAASKILSNLLTSFFHLGGVLIATSNRMPEELANASGVEFAAPSPTRLGLLNNRWGLLGSRNHGGRSENMFSGRGDFAAFLEVLRARCEILEMGKGKDWRRREAEEEAQPNLMSEEIENDDFVKGAEGLEPLSAGNLALGYEQSLHIKSHGDGILDKARPMVTLPKHFFVRAPPSASQEELAQTKGRWKSIELRAVHGSSSSGRPDSAISWQIATLRVYGRNLQVPRSLSGVSKWTFVELCSTNLGPADYITIASTFHTLILTDVPILTLLQKNEARRFITLLDALYEARCKLLMSAEAGPDDIFFPETNAKSKSNGPEGPTNDEIYPETFSEIYQDRMSPFRPNVSAYTSSASPPSYASSPIPSSPSQAASARSILADEDSDFGPVYGAGRSHGPSDGAPGAGNEIGRQSAPDFARTGSFTGEDERFAYKRARSRLWEMCGSRWWAREEEGWWKPLSKDIRRWEGAAVDSVTSVNAAADASKQVKITRDAEGLFRHGASPFRTSQEAPPKFGWQHAWGMMTWGRKAGVWGKGPDGLNEKKKSEDD